MKEKLEKLFDEMATTGLNPTPKIDKEEFVLLATRLLQDELSSIANRWPGNRGINYRNVDPKNIIALIHESIGIQLPD
jgi:hypothetical protein